MAKMALTAFRRLLSIVKSDEGTVAVPVGRTRFAYVDAADGPKVLAHKWRRRGEYAAAYVDGVLVRMHNFLNPSIPDGHQIDHKDGDGLNNRRGNLRVCTPQQNACNRRKLRPTKSRFKGVTYLGGKWRACVWLGGRVVFSNDYDTQIGAARAYDWAAKRYHGEFAKTNADLGLY